MLEISSYVKAQSRCSTPPTMSRKIFLKKSIKGKPLHDRRIVGQITEISTSDLSTPKKRKNQSQEAGANTVVLWKNRSLKK